LGLKSADGPRRAGEAGPCAVARRPAVWPNSQLGLAGSTAQHTERAPALVTAHGAPGRRSRRQPVSGLGAAAPVAGAPARYEEPAEQHEGGEGSPGRWRDGGGSGRHGELTSGGLGRQRRRRDGGGRQSGGAVVREQGMGRR
jgi:hypothetical protein